MPTTSESHSNLVANERAAPPSIASRLDCRLTFLVYEFLVRFAVVVEPWRKSPISIEQFEEAFSLSASDVALGAHVSARHAREYVTYLINVYHPIRLARSSANEEAEKLRWEDRVYNAVSDLVKDGYLSENPYPENCKFFFDIPSNDRLKVLYALTCRALQTASIRNHMQLHRNLVRTKPVGSDSNATDYYILAGTERVYAVNVQNTWSLVSLGSDDIESLLEFLRSSKNFANNSLARMLNYDLTCRAAAARAAASTKERPKDPVFRALRNLGIDLDVAVSFQNINRTRSQTTQSTNTSAGVSRTQGGSSGPNASASLTSKAPSVSPINSDELKSADSPPLNSNSTVKSAITTRRKRGKKDAESLLREYKSSLGIKSQSTLKPENSNGAASVSNDAFKKLLDGSKAQATKATRKTISAATRQKRPRSESPPATHRTQQKYNLKPAYTENDASNFSRESSSPDSELQDSPASTWSVGKDQQGKEDSNQRKK